MFIDKNQLQVNIYAQFEQDGVTYPNLTDPAVRAAVGVTEIADPVPPADYSEDVYYRTEQREAPYVVYTRKSDEQIRAAELAKLVPLTPRQIRQALTRAGLRSAVEAVVAAGDQDMKDWWEFTSSFERSHPMVVQAGQALGQSEAQMDALWKLGASL